MKMETPKMDVVRFEEADVIVASPIPGPIDTVTISGVGDTVTTNNYLSYGSTTLDLKDADDHHISFGNGFNNNGVTKTLEQLVKEANESDPEDSVNADWNHIYNWNNSTKLYEFFPGQ